MNCSSCGTNLPPGATACPWCGTPVPYNAAQPGSSPQIDPTMPASPYRMPGGPGNPQPVDPTPQYGTPPSTAYGAPPYNTPSPPIQPSQNSYGSANPYGIPPQQYPPAPPPPNQYGVSPQQRGYGQPGAYPSGEQFYGGTLPPPKPRSRMGLIIAIVIGMIALLCIAGFVILYEVGKNSVNTLNTTATTIVATVTSATNETPTTTNATPTVGQGTPPSGQPIDPTAASYITNTQMSSAVDSDYRPTATTTTFTTGQTIYATFKIASSAPSGYVTAKWYSNGAYAFTSNPPLAVKGGFAGYLAAKYNIATQGTVEYYFCTQKDCSDAKLADVLNFTVTSTSMVTPTWDFSSELLSDQKPSSRSSGAAAYILFCSCCVS